MPEGGANALVLPALNIEDSGTFRKGIILVVDGDLFAPLCCSVVIIGGKLTHVGIEIESERHLVANRNGNNFRARKATP